MLDGTFWGHGWNHAAEVLIFFAVEEDSSDVQNLDIFGSSMVIACHSLFSVYWCYTSGDDVEIQRT